MSTLDTSCGPQRLSSRPRSRSGTIRASLPQPQPQPQPHSADGKVAAQWLRLSVAAAATERPCRPVAVSGAHSGASRGRQWQQNLSARSSRRSHGQGTFGPKPSPSPAAGRPISGFGWPGLGARPRWNGHGRSRQIDARLARAARGRAGPQLARAEP